MADSERRIRIEVASDTDEPTDALGGVGAGSLVLTSDVSGEGPRIVFADMGFLDLTGYSVDSVRGAPLAQFLASSVPPNDWNRLRTSLMQRTPWNGPMSLRRVDGGELHLQVSTRPLGDGSDGTSHFVAEWHHGSSRLSRAVAIEDLQAKLAAIEHLLPVGFCVTELGGQYVMKVSPKAAAMFELTECEESERTEVLFSRIHPDDKERLVRLLRTDLLAWRETDAQYRAILPDGRIRWIHTRAVPVRSTLGTPKRIISTSIDVTDRVVTEKALSDVEQRYHAMLEVCDVALILLEAQRSSTGEVHDFYVKDLNARAVDLLGIARDSTCGRSLRECAPALQAHGIVSKCIEVLEKGGLHQELVPGTLFGIAPRWLRWRAVPLADGVAVSVRDVSWERDLSVQVARASRLESIGSLAAGIAHDFNNMLSAIVGFGELARDELPHDAPARADIEQVMQAAERATQLTRYLLAFGRRQPLEQKLADLGEQLQELSPILRRLAGTSIAVKLDVKKDLNTWLDPGLFEQAVVNLVVNARDAMPQGGTLSVLAEPCQLQDADLARVQGCSPGEYIRIVVSDTGVGMSEPTLARIFEPFFTTKGDQGGTGLGLASVWGFVKQCGGTVVVDSTLGQGTTMHLYFPVVRFGRRASSAPAKCLSRLQMRHEVTVMVVDSDESVRSIARRVLQLNGCSVREAASAADAEAVIERDASINVLLTAIGLPQSDGIALARKVRCRWPHVRVVLMSGAADMRTMEDVCDELGAVFLQKPFSTAQLMIRIGEVLGQDPSGSQLPSHSFDK